MNKPDLEFDLRLSSLESEWRQAYEASRAAGEEFVALTSNTKVKCADVQKARAKVDRTEELKARIMAKIEQLERVAIRRFDLEH